MRLTEEELWENFRDNMKPCLWNGGWTLEEVKDAFRTGYLLGSLRRETNQKDNCCERPQNRGQLCDRETIR